VIGRTALLGLAQFGEPGGPAVGQQRWPAPPPAGLDWYVPVPEENTPTSAKVALGRALFFEPGLSRDSTVACVSCHRPAHAFSDTTRFSRGIGGARTTRNAPSILNRAYGAAFFWDGRAVSLEAAVVMPIRHSREMGLPLDQLVQRLRTNERYARAFDTTFTGGVTEANLARALASYVRTLRSGDAPIDRFYAGDAMTLDSLSRAGFRVFNGKGSCSICHAGPTFTDEQFHNTGVSWGGGDLGRFAVTRDSADLGAFKTPSLRNVALTAPYMHDGSIATLEAVVEFYDRGGNPNPRQDAEIRPLRLRPAEKRSLIAFLLRALTGRIPDP
jgi:cytochrome c peroxidase